MHRAVVDLLEGNADHARRYRSRFEDLQDGQHPVAVVVSCADARVLADHLWDNDAPGRLFTSRNIGNRVVQRTDAGAVVSGDVLFPIRHLGTELAVVLGHTGCGAVTAAYDALTDGGAEPPGIRHCVELLTQGLEAAVEALPPDLDRSAAVNRLVEVNVDRQVDRLLDSDDVPASVTVLGAVYDFGDVYAGDRGEVHVINVDGETAVGALRADHPEIADRVRRLAEP